MNLSQEEVKARLEELVQSTGWELIKSELKEMLEPLMARILSMEPAPSAKEIWRLKVAYNYLLLFITLPDAMLEDFNKSKAGLDVSDNDDPTYE